VGSYAPNGYGLHDMAGNVLEQVADLYSGDYYK
jgi:formylglycine-generating enzyme required for sulfatase activity